MFQAVIVNFDAKHGVGLVGYFSVAVNSSERPVVIRVGLHEFLKSNKSLDAMFLFGESDYANEYVPRLGKQFLGPFLEIREKTVYRTSVKEAGAAALSFLVATEESAKIKKPTYGIGGPVDLATITNAGVTVERH